MSEQFERNVKADLPDSKPFDVTKVSNCDVGILRETQSKRKGEYIKNCIFHKVNWKIYLVIFYVRKPTGRLNFS